MSRLRLDDLSQYSDLLHTTGGETLTVRFVEPRDADALQDYFRSLSVSSRYNRFFGAMGELPKALLHRFTHVNEVDGFTVIATQQVDGVEIIVAEARYAFHEETRKFEFGISVADAWHGRGIGTALLRNLECRAAAFGAISLFGDTLRSNRPMTALARKARFDFVKHPYDWKLVRFDKTIDVAPEEIPCASWRLAAASREAAMMN